MLNKNFYNILKEVSEKENITSEIFEEILNIYDLNRKKFEEIKNDEIEIAAVSKKIEDKLFNKTNRNFHTISSKENFQALLETEDEKVVNSIVFHPLNDHSRLYLGVGDVLFSYRIGQFGSLEEALETRGIYGVGLALSNPIKMSNEHEGDSRNEYKDYGVIVIYPFKLEKHLSVKNIQLNPKTIDLTPYNGNRNDSIQYIKLESHYNTLLSMIAKKNTGIQKLYKKLNLNIKSEELPEEIWESIESYSVKDEGIPKTEDYKLLFSDWMQENKVAKNLLEAVTVQGYINSLNQLEETWNELHEDSIIKIWKNPYYIKDKINFEKIKNDVKIQEFNKKRKGAPNAALNYYKEFLNDFQNRSDIKGKNKIYFGAPGTGKSYKIKEFIKTNGNVGFDDKDDDPNVFRVTLHPEFTYSDFVGQVMPDVTTNGKNDEETQIVYKFVPQVFTLALKQAIKNTAKPVFLILEEMSRANVAAVFGDLFQLLDRDENGESEYRIDNVLISQEIYGDSSSKKLYLPNNLFIVGTVNTSDQNVFVMDTAFKRRFEYHYVNAQSIAKDKSGAPLNNVKFIFKQNEHKISFSWIDLYLNLNKFITKDTERGGLGLTEDKQIGQFFIKFRKNDEVYNYNQFKGKMIHYLWDDVQKISFTENSIFKRSIGSFSELFSEVESGNNVFSKEFLFQMGVVDEIKDMDEINE